jgi:hypothetical protein
VHLNSKRFKQQNMKRCCTPIPNEFNPSYASILASRDLQGDVKTLEEGPLLPCLTAWCSTCQAPYLITAGLGMFNSPSAHHAHMLTLARISQKRD